MKQVKSILNYTLLLILSGLLTSCTAVSRKIQDMANSPITQRYPAASPVNAQLNQPSRIVLRDYKSVQTRSHQRNDMAIVLAASGGGYRAANLTLGVLLGLEKINNPKLKGNLLQEVDYFSTVSGGGIGVGYYLAQLHNYLDKNRHIINAQPFSLNQIVQNEVLQDEAKGNTLRADLTQYLFFGQLRGSKIEGSLNDGILDTGQGGLKLGDIFVPRQSRGQVELPYWGINTTVYQNMAILPFTPDMLARYQITGFSHKDVDYVIPGNFSNPYYAYDVPAAVGLTASLSVPFAIPATTLPSSACGQQCYLQLLDGGLADNLGVYTALNFLLQDNSKIKMLIVVDAYKGNGYPYSQLMTPPDRLSMIWRIATASTDSNHERINSSIHLLARDFLCSNGASNVIVVYLDLNDFPQAKEIGTQLTLSADEQQSLIKIGKSLVEQDETLKTFLEQMNNGNLRLGSCSPFEKMALKEMHIPSRG